MKKILLIIPLLIGCSSTKEKSEYESLFDYEGKYEYVDNTTLELKASAMDTTLYAVIDKNFSIIQKITNINSQQKLTMDLQRAIWKMNLKTQILYSIWSKKPLKVIFPMSIAS